MMVKVTVTATGPSSLPLRPVAFWISFMSLAGIPWVLPRLRPAETLPEAAPCCGVRLPGLWSSVPCVPDLEHSNCVAQGKSLSFLGVSPHLHGEDVPVSNSPHFAVLMASVDLL